MRRRLRSTVVVTAFVVVAFVVTATVVPAMTTTTIRRPVSQFVPLIDDRLIHAAGLILHLLGHAAVVVVHFFHPARAGTVHGTATTRQTGHNGQGQSQHAPDFHPHDDYLLVSLPSRADAHPARRPRAQRRPQQLVITIDAKPGKL